MSLWTPGGEVPVERNPGRPDRPAAQAHLASAPAAQVITNHIHGFFELARIHLGQDPPNFDEASLAIDAMAGVLDAVEPRLGPDGPAMRQGLVQLQAVFVELRNQLELAED